VGVADCLGDADQFRIGAAGVVSEHFEGGMLVDSVALHKDALGALGDRAAGECAFQAVVFGEAAKGDPEGALELFGLAVDDVGEDADLGGLVDEIGVFDVAAR
jgi:hypothetical protein